MTFDLIKRARMSHMLGDKNKMLSKQLFGLDLMNHGVLIELPSVMISDPLSHRSLRRILHHLK